jgi:ABC-type antimicrobial peptide transport system permease subunit
MAIPLSYNLRNLVVRKTMTLMTAGGIALVVAVLVLTLALAHGFQAALVATGRDDNLLVMRTGATSEVQSSVTRDGARILEADPAMSRLPDGRTQAVGEVVVLTNLTRRGSVASSNIVVRGVDDRVLAVRPEVRLVEGRFFRPGVDEVIVGRPTARRFSGCGLGETVRFGSRDWRVVGLFEANGAGFESEIWGDVETLMPAFDRTTYQSVTLRMEDPNQFSAIKARLEADPRLQVDVRRESEYYAAQSDQIAQLIRVLGMFLVIVMAVGAIFGALNTMYAAVGSRTREIGTMLALGFTPRSVLRSFLIESVLLSLVGGVLGCLLSLPIHGVSTGTTNWSTFSEVAFQFRITPGILATGLLASVLLGLIGGYFPARNAARRTVHEALREN